ncbi:MAG: hypothetical protein SNG97_06335 [Rikenellaceae bacterium]
MAIKDSRSNRESTFDVFAKLVRKTLQGEEFYSRAGKVLSVDLEGATAEVEIIGGATVDDVLLQKVASNSGVMLVPAVDSIVVVDWLDSVTAYVAMCSQVDSVALRGDGFGGLVKVEQVVASLNALERDVNDLKNLLGSAQAVPQDGGAAILLAIKSWTSSQLTESQRADFENEKIKHGDGN